MEGESAKRGGEETLKSWAPLGLLAGLLALLLWLGGQGAAAPAAAAPQASAVPAASGQPERVFVRLSAGTERERAEAQAEEADAEPEMELAVYLAQEDRLSVMGLEDFVRHAVAGEMPASFAPEALKAQAVAARSYALWKSALFGGGGCSQRTGADVCTDSGHCMAYADESSLRQSWGEDYQENWAAVCRAVEETEGLVCAYDGEPIQALFHAVSGGRTEDAVAVFQNALPYLTSVESQGEEGSAEYRAELFFSGAELAQRLNAAFPGAGLDPAKLPQQLELLSRTDSGRVEELRLGARTATGRQLRQALGLNSTNFSLSFEDGGVRIQTLGYGHGVGMSQVGANAMAQEGADFAQILTHYYQGVSIVPAASLLGD